ncbi:hypothetical protein AC249_AIPGENE4958, partial [Exaiptasia diaphana]
MDLLKKSYASVVSSSDEESPQSSPRPFAHLQTELDCDEAMELAIARSLEDESDEMEDDDLLSPAPGFHQ